MLTIQSKYLQRAGYAFVKYFTNAGSRDHAAAVNLA
jgi:hypothetical protein